LVPTPKRHKKATSKCKSD